MYNKSEIMKRAWRIFKADKANHTGMYIVRRLYKTFGEALKSAWATAKNDIRLEAEARAKGMIKACELKVGDTISVDGFGGYDDVKFTKTIVSVEPLEISGKHFVVVKFNDYNANACLEVNDFVTVVAPMVESHAA